MIQNKKMYSIPNQTKTLLGIIENSGFEAYIVGGAVRDIIIGRIPHDWDIMTDALPCDIERIFHGIDGYRTEDIGKKNGTITVIRDLGEQTVYHEITTYRVDGEYSDGRHPDYVRFSKSLKEDLLRRDFTINAIAMDRNWTILDPLSGFKDIEDKLIKAVGSPAARFSEDALRILRGIRFESELNDLGFKIDIETKEAMISKRFELKSVSIERIQSEFNRIMLSSGASLALKKYREIIDVFIPELEKIPVFYEPRISPVLQVRLALLLAEINSPEEILKRLKYSRRIIEDTLFLIRNRNTSFNLNKIDARKKLNMFGEKHLKMLISMKKSQSEYTLLDEIRRIEEFERIVQNVIDEGDCYKLTDLAVDGKDIIEFGVEEGPDVGKMLNYILDGVIEGRISNDRESIMREVEINLTEPSL